MSVVAHSKENSPEKIGSHGMTCRICGSIDTSILPIGKYEEFFRLRVDTGKDDFQLFSRANTIEIKAPSRPIRALRKIGRILSPPKPEPAVQFRTHMQACASCHGITPCHEYSFEDLLGLYQDYRSENYNRDRISVEPYYARIAKDVGSHPLELKGRNAAVENFLSKNLRHFAGGAMLDYGGSDGRFIPSFAYGHFETIHIYDASKAPLHSSVDARKVEKIAVPRFEGYSFLTCMHVLEHVGNPRALVAEAAQLLIPGGLMYLEVPLELTQSVREDFAQKIIDTPIGIHEHMNRFDRKSIVTLVESIGELETIDEAEDVVDLGWTKALVGRVLARKAK